MFRAGREDEAIASLNEGINLGVMEFATDWAFLAMAQVRKGRIDQAHRDTGASAPAAPDPLGSFWEFQELAILRSEAESMIFDAGFPSDPFSGPKP